LIDPDDRIRASFNQCVAKTGRLSCSSPNLQNIPARYRQDTTEGTMIRQFFRAPDGYLLIVADFSQIELRIMAHLSKDRMLLRAFQEGRDLHTQTATLLWHIREDQVTPEQRAIAKNSNFALAFGGGAARLASMADIPLRDAEKVHASWHAAYPGVRRWGRWITNLCHQQGYVTTIFGRKRRLPGITSPDGRLRGMAERQALNAPIQGSAAEICKIGLVQTASDISRFDARLILQVHDELVIECRQDEVEAAIPVIRDAMTDVSGPDGGPVLAVPLEVNVGVGSNWHEAK
jgi:DNA polymerase-1